MAAAEEPILPRLDRLDNILRQLEDIRCGNRTPKSSCASTPSSGTLTSDGHASSVDFFSPKRLEKHCRSMEDAIMETELKGTLLERLVHVEDRVLKLCLQLEEELQAEKKRGGEGQLKQTPEKKRNKKKGLKNLVKSCVQGKHKSN